MEITGTTKLLCLLGDPVAHSKSPLMHNTAAQSLNLDYAYMAFRVREDELRVAVDGLKLFGARGWNLTMPLKTAMADLADELSPASALSHSVNTIVNNDGHLVGYTTDGIGFMRSIAAEGIDVKGKEIVLLGAGGAASAICVQAALDGVKAIHMFKRENERWNTVADFVGRVAKQTGCEITLENIFDPSALKARLAESSLLVNATNVGMAPNADATPIDASLLFPEMPVCDIIYNPLETRLVREAKAIGCKAFNGLYMLLYQGAASFELWTGHDMPVEEVKKVIL
jgi:shikimate dehydrogenase